MRNRSIAFLMAASVLAAGFPVSGQPPTDDANYNDGFFQGYYDAKARQSLQGFPPGGLRSDPPPPGAYDDRDASWRAAYRKGYEQAAAHSPGFARPWQPTQPKVEPPTPTRN